MTTFPGIHVSVVNSYAAASLFVSEMALRRDDFPTEGNPTNATRPSAIVTINQPIQPTADTVALITHQAWFAKTEGGSSTGDGNALA